ASPSKPVLKRYVANFREAAERVGRNPREILAFNLHTVILGETDAEAQRKFNEYRKYSSFEGALTLISGWTCIDCREGLDGRLHRIGMEVPQHFV
ncbi:hypothetical protein AB9E31_35800, partial [Rhizobium leguminosarum]